MNDFQEQPGGGFSSVGGYNDIAGSQAEEHRRMQDDELNRQRMEQSASDAAAVQAESRDSFHRPNATGGRSNHRRNRSSQQRVQTQKAKNPPPAATSEIHPGFAILGFVVAGIWGMGLLAGDGRWFSGLVVGLIGAHVAGHYHKVLIAAGLVGAGWWFLSHDDPTKSQPVAHVDSVTLTTPGETILSTPIDQTPAKATVEKSVAQTPEQEVAERYPYPPKPTLLLKPHQDLATDPTRMRDFRQMMLDYEEKTGKSFLTDHRSMKSVTRVRFDYISRYGDGELLEGLHAIPKLSAIEGIWNYSGPQLWELDLKATVDQHFFFQTKYSNGKVRDGVLRTYSGDGLCYKPMSRPLFRNGIKYEAFQLPVQGGKVWREFARSVYVAKTDAQLLALDPINLAIAQTHRDVAIARKNYEMQLRLIDGQRESLLPLVRAAAWNMQSSQTTR